MLPYLSVFFMSSGLLALSDKIKKSQRYIFVILALILPCILAGLRASFIGTDTEVYLMPTINAAISSNSFSDFLDTGWFRIWRYLYVRDFERGFTLLIYVSSRLLGLFWTKFIIQALIIVPVYVALKKYKKYPIWFGMLIFYFLTYNSTLNMIRQSIAVSFMLLGLIYLMESERRKFLLCFLVSISFHISGIILVINALLYFFIKSKSKEQDSRIFIENELTKVLIIFVFGILTLFSIGLVSKILGIIGLGSYSHYFNGVFHFVPNRFLIRLPILFLIIFNWRKWNYSEDNSRFFLAMFMISIMCSQLVSVNTYSGRIAYYFTIFEVLSIPSICYANKNRTIRYLMILFIIVYLVVYWWSYYYIEGIDATVPYMLFRQ
ncbi:EpsG family protein [Streptococcus pluranimalium]